MAERHAILTGPIRGSVILQDGTEVPVSDEVVYVDSPERAAEVAHLVSEQLQAQGHPDFIPEPDVDFVHIPLPEFEGYEPHPEQAAKLERAREANPELLQRVEALHAEIAAAGQEG